MGNIGSCVGGAGHSQVVDFAERRPAPPPTYDERLLTWVDAAPRNERHARAVARDRILDWRRRNDGLPAAETTVLDLHIRYPDGVEPGIHWAVRQRLSSLPPEIAELTNLRELDLSGNLINHLPPEMGRLTNLTALHLGENPLVHLPPLIGQLINLTSLNLADTGLTDLPPEIFQLTNLVRINLRGNQLTELSPQIGRLTELAWLDLSGNRLTRLPPQIGQLQHLTRLELRDNRLAELPAEIAFLTNLTVLCLDNNQIAVLPREIGRLRNLAILNLNNNRLTRLLPEMGGLTQLASLELFGNPELSRIAPPQFRALGAPVLRQLAAAGFYHNDAGLINDAPQAAAVREAPAVRDDPALWGARRHYGANAGEARLLADHERPALAMAADGRPIDNAESFFSWLERIRETRDYMIPAYRPVLRRQLQQLIEDLRIDESLRRTCFDIAADALASCEDRVALALNDMHLATINAKALREGMEAPALVDLGRRRFALDLVNRCAWEKIATLRGTEDIEVILAYQTALRAPLDLPLLTADMHYRGVSGVRDEDLAAAERQIRGTLADGHSLKDFLLQWPPLRQFVQRRETERLSASDDGFYELLEKLDGVKNDEGMSSQDFKDFSDQILQNRDQNRERLTSKFLDELLTTILPASPLAVPSPPHSPARPPENQER